MKTETRFTVSGSSELPISLKTYLDTYCRRKTND